MCRSSRPEVFCKPATLLKKESEAQAFSGEFYEISKNTFFYRTPLVTISVFWNLVFITKSGHLSHDFQFKIMLLLNGLLAFI